MTISFNRINLVSLLAIFAILFTACTKQVKSPKLIYGSRQSGGIQIDRGVDGSAIPSVNIGWTLHDIALVPVAVVIYDVKKGENEYVYKETFQIWGTSKLTNGDGDDVDSSSGLTNNILEGGLVLDLDEIKTSYSDGQFDELLFKSSIANSAESVSFLNNRAFIDNNIDKDTLADTIANKYYSNGSNNIDNGKIQTLKERLVNNLKSFQSSERHDAFSVFGSFESGMDVEGNNAGITLGKIFATGVAAQLISSGSADALRNQTSDTCLNRIRQLQKTGINLTPQQAISLCASIAEIPAPEPAPASTPNTENS